MPTSRVGPDGKFERGDLAGGVDTASGSGVSIFDPVLSELCYRWFCPPKGLVLDPFAGGSVRGIVASRLGLSYLGIELRPEQVAANRVQGDRICNKPKPEWIAGDARQLPALAPKLAPMDFLFTCPPYGDLERYSDDPADLSTMPWLDFLAAYREIIGLACAQLKPDRFAAIVVGDYRGPDGAYRAFPWETIAAFQDAGLKLWNEAVLVTAVGSLPIRARRAFETGRKLGKTHQNLLVFLKGDPKRAVAALGPVDVSWPDDADWDPSEPQAPILDEPGSELEP